MIHQDDSLQRRVRDAVKSQSQKTVTVLSSLLSVEDAVGYIPSCGIDEVARATNQTVNDVWAVASFYTNFRFDPANTHTIEVCWGPTCHIRGAQDILNQLHQILGLETEGDTHDGSVTLKYNTCLGACSNAPVVMIDRQLTGGVTPEIAAHLAEDIFTRDE